MDGYLDIFLAITDHIMFVKKKKKKRAGEEIVL